MTEKMYAFTKLISETTLWALLTQHAAETKIDIFQPQKRYQKKLENGHAGPLLLEAPQRQPRGGSKPKGELTLSMMVLEHFADNPKRVLANPELIKIATNAGRAHHGVSVAINSFLQKGYVERTGKGQYKVLKEGIDRVKAERKAREDAAPQATPKVPGVGSGNYERRKSGAPHGRRLILAALAKSGEPQPSAPFRKLFADNGLTPSSINSAFSFFVGKGYVTKVSKGVFRITKDGTQYLAQLEGTNP